MSVRSVSLAGAVLLTACAGLFSGDAPPRPLLAGIHPLTFEGRRAGEGYFSADGRRLVFQSEREPGNPFFQIYRMELATGDVRRISPGIGKTTCSWEHPSGARVLLASTHEDPAAVAKQTEELEFRKSGQQRRYAWDYDAHYDLYAAEIATGALTALAPAPGYDAEGSYSPDGRWIAFASNRHAFAPDAPAAERAAAEADPAGAMEIYLMAADGTQLRRLTTTPGYDGGPFFSPDGTRLTWRRFTQDGATAEVYTMRTDGSDVRQLTRLGALSFAPFYHPSGAYLIFGTNVHGFDNFELYLVDVDGTRAPVRVTESDGFDGLPAFAPDGARLAWTRRSADDSSQLFLARWDHAEALRRLGLPAGGEEAFTPTTDEPAAGATSEDAVRAHVEALTGTGMDGRMTGTEGETRATEYVARAFAEAGLEPAGANGTWFEPFEFTAGVSLGPANALRTMGAGGAARDAQIDRDWRPLAFSRAGKEENVPVVFAGYGIVAPPGNGVPAYDAYAGADVQGKLVLVLRYAPQNLPPQQRQHLARYSLLRHKAMLARERGAVGLIVASGPRSQVRDQLVPLRNDAAVGAGSLYVLSVTDALAEAWVGAAGRRLGDLQGALDSGTAQPALALPERVSFQIDLVQERRAGRNVLGRLRAPRADRDAAPVLIGAHVDHLGHGEEASSLAREDERGRIHPGADDNASGVAAVIEIARQLGAELKAQPDAFARDVLFAAWSGEEIGLIGSTAYARDLPDPVAIAHGAPRTIAAVLNLDMVGRLRETLVLQGAGSSPVWPGLVERVNAPLGLPVALQSESYLPTDSTAFHLKGIPVLSAFTGAHAEYHTPRDTADTLNYEGLAEVADLVAGLGAGLAEERVLPERLEPARPEAMPPRAGLRAYLGTIPSYGEVEGRGVTLSGVSAGGPAEQAGLRAGDRIVELGGHGIENIYDYTFALDTLTIGTPAPIVIVRDGKRLTLTITPGSRD
jgi:Tol biopolymer transport system component